MNGAHQPLEVDQWRGVEGECPHCQSRINLGSIMQATLDAGVDALDDIPKEVWLAVGIFGFVWPVLKWLTYLIVIPAMIVIAMMLVGI